MASRLAKPWLPCPKLRLMLWPWRAKQLRPSFSIFPAGASGPCDGGHVVGRDLQAGEERVGVGALAVAFDHELDPSPHDGVLAVAHRQPVHPAEALPLDLLGAVAGLEPAAGMDEVVVQKLI